MGKKNSVEKNEGLSCRRNRVGGQAVIEGVMMKNGSEVALAVRKEDGTIEIEKSQFIALKTKHKWINIPIIRGVVGFFESMALSLKTLTKATDMLGLDEEDEATKAKKEKKKQKKLEKKGLSVAEPEEKVQESSEEKTEDVAENQQNCDKNEGKNEGGAVTIFLMGISLILSLGLSVLLFIYLPSLASGYFGKLVGITKEGWGRYVLAAIEGLIKIIIFIAYLGSVSLMKDIRRTFQYHGAEHKSIACFESGLELTPENARKCTRFHPRCGTSFMFVMILLGIIIGMFIPVWEQAWLRSLIKLALLPVTMGLGYEFIMLAGKHENWLTKALSAPGIWMQRITTKEPDEYQLAVAICAIKAALPEEFPDFDPSVYNITKEENKGHICNICEKKPKDSSKNFDSLSSQQS